MFKSLFERQNKRKNEPTRFRVGDHVRVAHGGNKFRQKWSQNIYEVTHVARSNVAIIRRLFELNDQSPTTIKHTTRRIATRLLTKVRRKSETKIPGQGNDEDNNDAEGDNNSNAEGVNDGGEANINSDTDEPDKDESTEEGN